MNLTDELLARLRSGALDVDEALALNDTLEHLEEHPSEEALDEHLVSSSTEGIATNLKARLKRPVQQMRPLSSFEELCYKELEGELSDAEQHELGEIITLYPQYAAQRIAILRTKLTIPTNIVYPHKERLKHYPTLFHWKTVLWKGMAVAACLFFVLWVGISHQTDDMRIVVAEGSREVHPQMQLQVQPQTTPLLAFSSSSSVDTKTSLPKKDGVETKPAATTEDAATINTSVELPIDEEPTATMVESPLHYASTEVGRTDMDEAQLALVPLASLPVQHLSTNWTLALEPRDPMPEVYHDWEAIAAQDELAAFEKEMKALKKTVRSEPSLRAKFVDYVVALALR